MCFRWIALAGALSLFLSIAHADDLTIHLYPSPYRLNWSTPQSLAQTVVLSALIPNIYPEGHEIGHASIELTCNSPGEAAVHEQTGMTDTGAVSDSSLLLKQDLGLGILFYDFPGRLQTEEEIRKDIGARELTGALTWIHFQINPSTCERLETYLTEYRSRGDYQNYGLNLRPRYGEGSGCSAFAASFMELAGVLNGELGELNDAWYKQIGVPLDLIGSPSTGQVSLETILFGKSSKSWDSYGAPSNIARSIYFWDPDTLFNWVQTQMEHYPVEQIGFAKGIRIDARNVATPTDAIWKSE